MNKPTLPQGTRDFGPDVVRKRNFILNSIKSVFEVYGFQPLETPAMENLDTLIGKYGEEGDKLIFKILNNGLDNPEKETQVRAAFENLLQGKNSKNLTERALKYDLTIPFARYVATHHQQLTFPFKRYQVQPVWRADRPQKGRYREFFQCDADVVGSQSLLNEAELIFIYHEALTRLGIVNYELRFNHRKLLSALAGMCGGPGTIKDVTIAIDKLDKQGLEKVKAELQSRGLTAEQTRLIERYLTISGSNEEKLQALIQLTGHTEEGKQGIEDLQYILRYLDTFPHHDRPPALILDPTLARGLDYYTGIIFEVKAPSEVQIGSIGGGGRYDDLTGLFGVPGIPGVGISFGVDRIYDVMEEMQLFPAAVQTGSQVLFFNMGEQESRKAFETMQLLRNNGIRCELFHEPAKLDKQFRYAEKKKIPFVIIIGEKELKDHSCTIKTLATGEQETIAASLLVRYPFG